MHIKGMNVQQEGDMRYAYQIMMQKKLYFVPIHK